MYKSKKQKGITLIALIITIIILLILVGVTINVFVGDNGLFNTTKQAGEEYTKSQLKEELEIEIANIQSKKIASGEEISREDLWELEKIGATMISVGTPAEGEYKDYNFTVDENYIVTIGEKSNIIKPEIQLTKNTEEIVETWIQENHRLSQPLQYIELHRDSAGASASRTGTGRLCASRRKIN